MRRNKVHRDPTASKRSRVKGPVVAALVLLFVTAGAVVGVDRASRDAGAVAEESVNPDEAPSSSGQAPSSSVTGEPVAAGTREVDKTPAATDPPAPVEPPAATAPVPDPAPARTAEEPEPTSAALDEGAELGSKVTARVTSIDTVTAVGRGPGDIGGEAYRVTVELTNGSPEPLDLRAVVLTLDSADGVPASPVAGDPAADPLTGELAAGQTARGVYLFSTPASDERAIRVVFSYDIDVPVAIFSGDPTQI